MPLADVAHQYASMEREVTRLVVRELSRSGVPVTLEQAGALVDRLYPRVTKARRAVYLTQMAELGRQAAAAGVELRPAGLEEYPRNALLDAIMRVARLSPDSTKIHVETWDEETGKMVSQAVLPDAANRLDDVVVARIGGELGARVARHVKAAGRTALADTALNGSARFSDSGQPADAGYARVLTGKENCAFCTMLASRGPVYRKDTAVRRKDGRRYHDGCDCTPVLVVDGKPWTGEKQFEKLQQRWRDVTWRNGKPGPDQWANWRQYVEGGRLGPKVYSPFSK